MEVQVVYSPNSVLPVWRSYSKRRTGPVLIRNDLRLKNRNGVGVVAFAVVDMNGVVVAVAVAGYVGNDDVVPLSISMKMSNLNDRRCRLYCCH